MKTTTRTVTTITLGNFELPFPPSSIMDCHEHLAFEKEGKTIIGYLADDADVANPLEDSDGYGSIFTSNRRDSRESHAGMQEALGLNRDWEPNFNLLEEEFVVAEAHRQLGGDLVAFDKALDYCRDNYAQSDAESDQEFVFSRLDTTNELYGHVDIEAIEQKLWEDGRAKRTIGHPHVVALDVYEHGGSTYSVSGGGMQDAFDTARGGAVWVPDAACIDEIERRAPVYRKGAINKLKSKFHAGGRMFNDWADAFHHLQDADLPLDTVEVGLKRARSELAAQACNVYNMYLAGDAYGIVVATFETESGEQISSEECWGFLGFDDAMLNLKDQFNSIVNA